MVRHGRCQSAKLDIDDARMVYECDDPSDVLASRLGIRKKTVRDIRDGKAWAWLTGAARRTVRRRARSRARLDP